MTTDPRDQNGIRDRLAAELPPGCRGLIYALLPEVEQYARDYAADQLDAAADQDAVTTAGLIAPGIASLDVVKTGDLRDRAADLRDQP